MNLNFREKTSLNVITNVMRTLAMALIGIFMVPYYVGNLGIASYAIIPLATTMASYIQIVSDSIAYASVRYSTLAMNSGDSEKANITLSSSFFGLGKVCLTIAPLGILLAIWSPAIFSISGSTILEVQVLFAMIILSSLIVTLSTPFNGVFYATNDLYLMYLAKFAYSIAQIGTIILLFVISEASLIEIGIGYLVSSILVFVLLVVLSKKIEPKLKISRKYHSKEIFKKISNLGFWSILGKIGGMLYIQLSMVLVNLYLGSEVQGGFAMIATIISMINTACYALVDSVEPFIYQAYSKHKSDEMVQILYTATKIVIVFMAFPVAFLVSYSEEFLTAWVGSNYVYLNNLIVIGILGNFSFCAVSAILSIPRIYLKIRLPTVITLILGLINAILTMIIIGDFGGNSEDALLIWALCTVLLSCFTAVYDAMLTGTRIYTFLISMCTGYLIIAITVPVLMYIRTVIVITPNWISLMALLCTEYIVYFIITYIVLFTKKEKTMVNSLLPHKLEKYLHKISLR